LARIGHLHKFDVQYRRVPDAVQREAQRSAAPLIRDPGFMAERNGVPGLQRITFVLRRARDTRDFTA
jgi:hypothetical protein